MHEYIELELLISRIFLNQILRELLQPNPIIILSIFFWTRKTLFKLVESPPKIIP